MVEFQFKSAEEKKAITGRDEDIYRELGTFNQSRFKFVKSAPHRWSQGIYVSQDLERPYDVQPARLPFTRDHLQAFIYIGLQPDPGYWSVFWTSSKASKSDDIYDDGFRCVVYFKTVDFMIRPLSESKNPKGEPPRLQ